MQEECGGIARGTTGAAVLTPSSAIAVPCGGRSVISGLGVRATDCRLVGRHRSALESKYDEIDK